MPRRISTLGCFAVIVLVADNAVADTVAGNTCAQKLSPPALQIYRAAVPDMRPGTNIPDLLREKVRPMVASGQIERAQARPMAEAAGACLQELQR